MSAEVRVNFLYRLTGNASYVHSTQFSHSGASFYAANARARGSSYRGPACRLRLIQVPISVSFCSRIGCCAAPMISYLLVCTVFHRKGSIATCSVHINVCVKHVHKNYVDVENAFEFHCIHIIMHLCHIVALYGEGTQLSSATHHSKYF